MESDERKQWEAAMMTQFGQIPGDRSSDLKRVAEQQLETVYPKKSKLDKSNLGSKIEELSRKQFWLVFDDFAGGWIITTRLLNVLTRLSTHWCWRDVSQKT